eukprot:13577242-Ditylum_brightwellii.AAC.2
MKKPQQGKLVCNNGEWVFSLGRKALNKTLLLPNFKENAISLAQQRKLFEGWTAVKLFLLQDTFEPLQTS